MDKEKMAKESFEKALEVFEQNNGILRTSQAKRLGINEATLMYMVDEGLLIKEGRGLYRLAILAPLSNPDLIQVSIKIPNSIICLISALNFHNLTTQIPYKVYVALPRGTKRPQIEYPPLDYIWPVDRIYSAGIEEYSLSGVQVRIYNKEKTIADCFKYRSKIGFSVALEALKDYVSTKDCNLDALFHYSRIDRVDKVIFPYVKALT
jgi:predicted transcriptional regulator of viral defense system